MVYKCCCSGHRHHYSAGSTSAGGGTWTGSAPAAGNAGGGGGFWSGEPGLNSLSLDSVVYFLLGYETTFLKVQATSYMQLCSMVWQ